MANLSSEQIQNLKEKLLAEKNRLEGDLKSFAKKDPEMKGDWDSKFPQMDEGLQTEDEMSDEVEEYGNELAAEYPLEEQLSDVNLALGKIEKGQYGICENCREEIPRARLEANPAAKLCMDCAKKE
ncbi:MAG: Sporulation protein, yteA family [candidate division CPR1 bacterium GW2011_GWA2_42_17]|uniref:Sporulation protein, yteA family n=1 Tax=candidate division CPR1 bacterium GW2011_GWA2_42_17 TaxID=1618341 RepID=A0A0G0Z7M8_9BACT|nr:MAG: Sporulation protein, yteA family [candidate division CPR1 bacterium GW2011_GWA2_42_17]